LINKTFNYSNLNAGGTNWSLWWDLVESNNLIYRKIVSWNSDVKPNLIDQFPGIEFLDSVGSGPSLPSQSTIMSVGAIFWLDDVLVSFWWINRELSVYLASKYNESLKITEEKLKTIFTPLVIQEENKVQLEFWFCAPNGQGSGVQRLLTVPTWDEIKSNYSANVQNEMERLVYNFKPSHGGQLILWTGAPGSGKTFAIRALTREWIKWCHSAYVIDPEVFFNNAGYMMSVLLQTGYDEDFCDDCDDEVGYNETKNEPIWKLIILEDCGELLSADAKSRSGQALSRLLNVADGLIGQGLNVLIIITTNEDIETLHSAISRPGRCANRIVFPKLTIEEANLWLKEHNLEEKVTKPISLAELYGKLEGFAKTMDIEKERLGFWTPPKPIKVRMGFYTGKKEEPLPEEHGEELGKPIKE